jgi:magnesium transporter
MFTSRHHQPGSAPATLVPREDAPPPKITLIQYNESSYQERVLERIEEAFTVANRKTVTWINIDGLGDIDLLQKLGDHFGLHPLALEDVMNAPQRPKVEEYDSHFFIIAQMAYFEAEDDILFEQLSLFFSKNFVITIQENDERDVFSQLRSRLKNGRGFARSRGHDYLAYAILDAVVDHFFPVLEPLGDCIESLEDDLLENPDRTLMVKLHDMKRGLLHLRRNAWPMRDVVSFLTRDESGMVGKETKIFLRDCYDHTIQIMEVIESYRDLSASLMDIYLSSLGMRTNDVMRVLTVVSTIFIQLTFIVGVYGMNFEFMPELKSHYGYAIIWFVMIGLAVGMLAIFKKNKWL